MAPRRVVPVAVADDGAWETSALHRWVDAANSLHAPVSTQRLQRRQFNAEGSGPAWLRLSLDPNTSGVIPESDRSHCSRGGAGARRRPSSRDPRPRCAPSVDRDRFLLVAPRRLRARRDQLFACEPAPPSSFVTESRYLLLSLFRRFAQGASNRRAATYVAACSMT